MVWRADRRQAILLSTLGEAEELASRKGKSRAHDWWTRALADGKHCEQKRRERFFEEYLEQATRALLPGELDGPFRLLYRVGFRLGYDNARRYRENANKFLPRPRKR